MVPLKSHSQEASVGFMDHSKGSFAIMVRGGPIQAKVIAPSLDLEGKGISNDLDLKPSIFCQVTNVKLIPKLLLLKEEGFHKLQIR